VEWLLLVVRAARRGRTHTEKEHFMTNYTAGPTSSAAPRVSTATFMGPV